MPATAAASFASEGHPAALQWAERLEVLRRLALSVPAVALVLAILFVPLAWLAWQSIRGPDGFTGDHYLAVLGSAAYRGYLVTTFQLAGLTTVICALLAYPTCYSLLVLPRGFAAVVTFCIVASFFASYLIRTYALLLLLQRRGVVNSFLMGQGWISQPLRLVYNFEGTLVGMVHILLPIMAIPLLSAMQGVDRTLVNAAMASGATPSRAFRDVFLPLSLPGLMSGCILVFILSLGFYLTPAILGGGRVVVWATVVATAAQENPVWGAASALGIILLVLTLGLLWLMQRLVGLVRPGRTT